MSRGGSSVGSCKIVALYWDVLPKGRHSGESASGCPILGRPTADKLSLGTVWGGKAMAMKRTMHVRAKRNNLQSQKHSVARGLIVLVDFVAPPLDKTFVDLGMSPLANSYIKTN